MTAPTYILQGVVGSQAHGLATADSDVDLLGVYSHPTDLFWNLSKPSETITGTDPDHTAHELEKFLRLAAKANPTVLEVLWLPEFVQKEDHWGDYLLSLRTSVLSTRHVTNAYLGYAESQFRKLIQRDDSFSSGTRKRTNKHARHLFRLLEQGKGILETGELLVKLPDISFYETISDMTIPQIQEAYLERYEDFMDVKSVLPDEPGWDALNDYLLAYRSHHQIDFSPGT